jgi:hypothetical protein
VLAPGVLDKLNFKAEAAVVLLAFILLSGIRGAVEVRARRLLGIPGEQSIGPRLRRNRTAHSTAAYTAELRLLNRLGLRPAKERPREFIFLGFVLILIAFVGLTFIAFATVSLFGPRTTDRTALDVGIGVCAISVIGLLRLAWVASYRVVARRRLWRSIAAETLTSTAQGARRDQVAAR